MMRHRTPIAPLEYSRRWGLRLWVGLVFAFLYIPLLTLIIFSFNNSKRNIVWKGFTLKYYDKALHNGALMEAFGNSLVIATLATLVSVVLGTLAAVMLWRFRFRFKPGVDGLMALPIVVPEIAMGVALLVFFSQIHWPTDLFWPFNLSQIIIAHVTFCFPFVTTVVRARLGSFNKEEEEAARDLGASEWRAFNDVLLPHLRPALIAGALLAFTLSLDDFVITYFTSGPNTITFPVKVYSMLRFSVTPEVNAASTLLIVMTIIFTTLGLWLQNRSMPKG
jgi:spermidine/putrescine transport system permease protein